jgi:hypothetical protein
MYRKFDVMRNLFFHSAFLKKLNTAQNFHLSPGTFFVATPSTIKFSRPPKVNVLLHSPLNEEPASRRMEQLNHLLPFIYVTLPIHLSSALYSIQTMTFGRSAHQQ